MAGHQPEVLLNIGTQGSDSAHFLFSWLLFFQKRRSPDPVRPSWRSLSTTTLDGPSVMIYGLPMRANTPDTQNRTEQNTLKARHRRPARSRARAPPRCWLRGRAIAPRRSSRCCCPLGPWTSRRRRPPRTSTIFGLGTPSRRAPRPGWRSRRRGSLLPTWRMRLALRPNASYGRPCVCVCVCMMGVCWACLGVLSVS